MIAALLFIAILDIGPLLGIGDDANAILTLLAALVFVVAHGYIAVGWRNIIAFSLITIVISFTSEAVGVATGLIFGAYHYTDLLGPKLLGVPPMIQIGYLATGYALGDDGAHHLVAATAGEGLGHSCGVFGWSIHHGELGRRDGSIPIDHSG